MEGFEVGKRRRKPAVVGEELDSVAGEPEMGGSRHRFARAKVRMGHEVAVVVSIQETER